MDAQKEKTETSKNVSKTFKCWFFLNRKTIPNTNIGIASAEIFILSPKAATSQAVAVVPILAPKINPIPLDNEINPALIKEIVITETNELDCNKAVTRAPAPILLYSLFVAFFNIFWSGPFVNTLNPSSNIIIPKSKIAIPADMVLKFWLKYSKMAKTIKSPKKKDLLIITLEG